MPPLEQHFIIRLTTLGEKAFGGIILWKTQEKFRAISSTAVNPRQWLTAYFRTRAHMASYESDFHCNPACTRPGCKNKNLLVQVSIVHLMGAAMHHNESVFATYQRNYTLGLFPIQQDIQLKAAEAKKPCPFLENDL